jgi:tetratricopeptide (TPR) repeat protein
MAAGFLEAEARFLEVRRLHDTGEMSEADYEEALRQLVLYEKDDFWMLGADSGAWYRLEGEQWVPAEPPLVGAVAESAPAPFVTEDTEAPPDRRRRLQLGLLVGIPLALVIIVGLLALFTPYPNLWAKSLSIFVTGDDADLYFERALIHRYELENLDGAVADVSAAIDQAPTAFLHEWRAEVFVEQGAYARAAADYTQAIMLDPDLIDLYVARAEVYQELDESALALEDMNRAIELSADDCYFYVQRAELYAQEGNIALAQQDYEHVVGLSEETCLWRAAAEDGLRALGAVASVPEATATPDATAVPAATSAPTPTPTLPAPTGTPVPIPTDPKPTSTPTSEPTATPFPTPAPVLRYAMSVGNGSFSDSLDAWEGTNNAEIVDGYKGDGVAITYFSASDFSIFQALSQEFEAEKWYQVSGWCLAPEGAECRIQLGDGNTVIVATAAGTGDWRLVSGVLRLGSNQQLSVYLRSPEPGSTVIYDEIEVYELDCGLVCDGSFDDGTAFWWSAQNALDAKGLEGNGLRVSSDDDNSDVYQALPGIFEGGRTYRASVWCNGLAGDRCRLFFGDAWGVFNPPAYENSDWEEVEANGDWQRLEVTVTLSRDERMFVYLYAKTPGSSVIYDDLVVEEVP